MNNMTVVYADAEEKYVKNVILYGKTADNYLYTDSKCSEVNKVDKDTLLNLCKKGVIINYNSTYYILLFPRLLLRRLLCIPRSIPLTKGVKIQNGEVLWTNRLCCY